MAKWVKIALAQDTAEFLALVGADHSSESVSEFINSLLRHERFRQGYPVFSQDIGSRAAVRSLAEKMPLAKQAVQSGFLPF